MGILALLFAAAISVWLLRRIFRHVKHCKDALRGPSQPLTPRAATKNTLDHWQRPGLDSDESDDPSEAAGMDHPICPDLYAEPDEIDGEFDHQEELYPGVLLRITT